MSQTGPPTTAEPVTFRVVTNRLVLVTLLGQVPGLVIGLGFVGLLWMRFGVPLVVLAPTAMVMIVYPTVFVGVLLSRSRSWLRSSAAGLEFTVVGTRPAFLPWSSLTGVSFRGGGLFTTVSIELTQPDAALLSAGPGSPPRSRLRRGRPAYVLAAGLMRPGPALLREELDKRLAARSAQGAVDPGSATDPR